MVSDNSNTTTVPSGTLSNTSLPQAPADVVLFQSTADQFETEDYHFIQTDPRSVFILALGAAIWCVLCLGLAHLLMKESISLGWLPPPPALHQFDNDTQ
jgi:hypothetical protein